MMIFMMILLPVWALEQQQAQTIANSLVFFLSAPGKHAISNKKEIVLNRTLIFQ